VNQVVLAVAGARKTQSIVDACAAGDNSVRRLALTFTLTGQAELTSRLAAACSPGRSPDVMGWYAFLLRHCIRPYLPLLYPGVRLAGLNFEGEPALGMYATGRDRFIDQQGRAYKLHISKLASDVLAKCSAAGIDRLQRIYDEIYIDEVQDLTGCDLDIVEALLGSTSKINLVGDVRQSVYDTNPRDPRHRQYRGLKMVDWFTQQAAAGRLSISYSSDTWRSNQIVASFSDTILDPAFGFPPTSSRQDDPTSHAGVFVLTQADVAEYVDAFSPLCLRHARSVARDIDLPFRNFGEVKGVTRDHVLIYPTGPITRFLKGGSRLKDKSACGFYVAVTRARHSVAFVVDKPDSVPLPRWEPFEPSR
jgi:DNA helicase-2/ATP-dependent DNA helicase PcrA